MAYTFLAAQGRGVGASLLDAARAGGVPRGARDHRPRGAPDRRRRALAGRTVRRGLRRGRGPLLRGRRARRVDGPRHRRAHDGRVREGARRGRDHPVERADGRLRGRALRARDEPRSPRRRPAPTPTAWSAGATASAPSPPRVSPTTSRSSRRAAGRCSPCSSTGTCPASPPCATPATPPGDGERAPPGRRGQLEAAPRPRRGEPRRRPARRPAPHDGRRQRRHGAPRAVHGPAHRLERPRGRRRRGPARRPARERARSGRLHRRGRRADAGAARALRCGRGALRAAETVLHGRRDRRPDGRRGACAGLVPMLCVGETEEEREAGATEEVLPASWTPASATSTGSTLSTPRRLRARLGDRHGPGRRPPRTPSAPAAHLRGRSPKAPRRGRSGPADPLRGLGRPDNAAELVDRARRRRPAGRRGEPHGCSIRCHRWRPWRTGTVHRFESPEVGR